MDPINLTGFTLSAGSGRCEIGFTGDYTPDENLVSTIQQKLIRTDLTLRCVQILAGDY